MNKLAVAIASLMFVCCTVHAKDIKVSEADIVIGKTITLTSTILSEQRQINIYLPNSYDNDAKQSYPVIYLLDGAMDEDFIHIAGLVQFASFPWLNWMSESIVVGIANVDRKRDFTYPSGNILDQQELPTSGESAQFISFIERELQPYVRSAFRTTKNETLIGQSLGGLLATEILFKQPNLFDNYVIVSPSLWWDDEKLLSHALPKFSEPTSIFIASGREGEVMERTAKSLYNKLNALESQNVRLKYEFFADKQHGDALHMAVYRAFEHIYKVPKDTPTTTP